MKINKKRSGLVHLKNYVWQVVVVAQLAERSLLTPEVLSLNPVIKNYLFRPCRYILLTVEKTNKMKKRLGMANFKKW